MSPSRTGVCVVTAAGIVGRVGRAAWGHGGVSSVGIGTGHAAVVHRVLLGAAGRE